ncbi:TPA: hypothetical protein ACGTRQ_003606 [Vibrio parahaemolyticus]
MKDDELAKLLCIAIILFAGFGIASLSSLLDVPFGVMMDSILLELIPVIIAGICIALKIKEGVSLQWGVPVFCCDHLSWFDTTNELQSSSIS